jgi:hypothetical protein
VSRGVTKWAINVAKKIGKEICFIGLRSEWSKEKNKVRMWIKRNGVNNMRCATMAHGKVRNQALRG